ncbi:MAG TPA: hypothetical protein DEB17_06295 [Chlorobaculum sp.]|uniref:Uncharacterized protein n=1 Tax=Chlorobaculum tepidum (strain ATCC 49652 / DSM 12025 / NBRC 103806 / TLS) TaxID=194439 RepID=Q8KCX6_CHLTE|nr:hypothetical protein CT1281 [Chlorobaculum tepidum TLS]HBU23592.1 hypothetical protein [Chlorobaculum sp.]
MTASKESSAQRRHVKSTLVDDEKPTIEVMAADLTMPETSK